MRGKLRKRTLIMKSCGITPAHAGKTRKNGQTYYNVEDHPRACGENEECPDEEGDVWGSPPRMRGKQIPRYVNASFHRITPAHAGKTVVNLEPFHVNKDHPRACGENLTTVAVKDSMVGSPPRMRGKLTTLN